MHMDMDYLFIFSVYVFNATLSASQNRLSTPALNAQIKKNEIGWTCGTYRKQERRVQDVSSESCINKTTWKAQAWVG
jgi:hypothetical protein